MPNEFGQPSGKTSFLTSLLGSTMDYFKKESDKNKAEDEQKKQMDYTLLMAAMKQLEPNLTPSQAGEILTRATEIHKPKGAGGLKDRIKEMFGISKPYEMQSGDILQGALNKPRAQIGEISDQSGAPSVFDSGYSRVELPAPPPMPVFEKTYREQELADREQIIGAQLEKQLAAQFNADQLKRRQREEQNKEIRERAKEMLDLKSDAEVDIAIKKKLTSLGLFEDTPENRELATESLRQDREMKRQLAESKITFNKQRIAQLGEMVRVAQERVKVAAAKLGTTKVANWNNDPQVKGAWKKVDEYRNEAGRLRTEASILHSKGDTEGAGILDAKAEAAETQMQNVINNIEDRIYNLNNPVKLPGPPSPSGGGGARRGTVKVTEAEILRSGGTKADVEAARKAGVLAQ